MLMKAVLQGLGRQNYLPHKQLGPWHTSEIQAQNLQPLNPQSGILFAQQGSLPYTTFPDLDSPFEFRLDASDLLSFSSLREFVQVQPSTLHQQSTDIQQQLVDLI